jgi:hypothetical protein
MYQVYTLSNKDGRVVYAGRVSDDPKLMKRSVTRQTNMEKNYGVLTRVVVLETEDVKAAALCAQNLTTSHSIYDLPSYGSKKPVEPTEPVVKVKRRPVVEGDGYPLNAFIVYDGTQLIRSRS